MAGQSFGGVCCFIPSPTFWRTLGHASRSCGTLMPGCSLRPPRFHTVSNCLAPCARDLQAHTDLVEPLSLDEAYLDVTENKTGVPTATRVASAIREQIRQELGLTASA